MERSVAAITAGLFSEMKKLDVISNNLANVNTPGFKRDETFSDWMSVFLLNAEISPETAAKDALRLKELLANQDQDGTLVDARTIMEEGVFDHTGAPLDVALQGDGFFTLQQGDREIYTRRGRFQLDEQGTLVSTDGFPVIGENDLPIRIDRENPTAPYEIRIDEDGTVYNNDNAVGRLKLIAQPEGERFAKIARTSFVLRPGVEPPTALGQVLVKQGYLETSNVSVVKEMTDMMNAYRTFESYQKIMTTMDDLKGRLISSVTA